MTNKVLGIIPARYNSTRFSGKPLADIGGKSMIQRVYEQAKKTKSLTQVIVATDDERIFNHVKKFDGDAMITSPHHMSGTDRCGEVVNSLHDIYDVIVNIQGDEPFIQPQQLELLITAFENTEIQIATLIKKTSNKDEIANPNIVKVVFAKNYSALYFSRNAIPYERDINAAGHGSYYKHLGIYAYRSEILKQIIKLPQSALEKTELLEQLRWLENNFSIHVIETNIDSVGIDTPEDLKKIDISSF